MQLYPKPSDQLVYDLINIANPGLPEPMTALNAKLGLPVAIANAPLNGLNTKVVATGRYGTKYRGKKELSYTRIDLGALFNNVSPLVLKYTSNGRGGALASQMAVFNQKYGLNLTEDDYVAVNFPASTVDPEDGRLTSVVTVTIKSTSLAYIGSFQLRWKQGNQDLKDLITNLELPVRQYPGGNVFDSNHKYVLSCDSYSIDFTEILNQRETSGNLSGSYLYKTVITTWAITNGSSSENNAINNVYQDILNVINQKNGTQYLAGGTPTSKWSLNGVTGLRVILPSETYPELNSANYNRAILLRPTANNQVWATGILVLHYNE